MCAVGLQTWASVLLGDVIAVVGLGPLFKRLLLSFVCYALFDPESGLMM